MESKESESPKSRRVRESTRVRESIRVRESESLGVVRGMERAPGVRMKANRLEDLLVYQRALEGIDAVSPIQATLRRLP